jgi:hypothetical protein
MTMVLVGIVAVLAALVFLTPVGKFFFGSGFMESPEAFEQRMAEGKAQRGATLNGEYLTNGHWCDSRGGRMLFAGGLGRVSFYRDSRPDSLVSEANYSLSGNQLSITRPSGAPLIATLNRIDGDTMTMSIPGRPIETVDHCS